MGTDQNKDKANEQTPPKDEGGQGQRHQPPQGQPDQGEKADEGSEKKGRLPG
ncbi:hypothetical protein PE067_09485 [Paracoccus sp. DMF-8]|uniref:hypothetical protein n=1 Tax=Paracoccus sp. DMF-8 TaxID=3019445 RepID=UPI0023E76568|nr:hypothetical protein [Paracoccus sp. DMF-8]MDF3606143.1 hypothetical protein [Paracoccus sp. DMF-8]MDF3606351.1 hypothetical protein [Paracoccus sp. DMF-8]